MDYLSNLQTLFDETFKINLYIYEYKMFNLNEFKKVKNQVISVVIGTCDS